MMCIKLVIKRFIRKSIIILGKPFLYLFASYLVLFMAFLMTIHQVYKNNERIMTYSYFDFIVNQEADDSILMNTSPKSLK